MPRSLKGISDEAREYAKQAAEIADVPVGAWLSSVIDAAANDLSTTPAQGVSELAVAETTSESPRQEEGSMIERAFQVVSDCDFEPEGPARDADLIEDPDLLQASLEALEQRIATSESLTEGDAQAPQRLRRIEQCLAARAPEPPTTPPPSSASLGKNEIKEFQTLLDAMNFNPGPVDGSLGSRTTSAIKLYPKFAGLEADGKVNQASLEDLRAVAATMSGTQ